MVHDFKERLAFSESARLEAFWGAAYAIAFPDMVSHYLNARDNGAQRAGVDRVILLRSTKMLRIDEKTREQDYGDILIEYVSNDRTGAVGWIEKDLTIDYLAYGVLPQRRVYLFPWEMLRRVWVRFGLEWVLEAKAGRMKHIVAPNHGYNTLSIAVPLKLLQAKVSTACVIQLPDENAGAA